MKIKTFVYTKDENDITKRRVLVLNENKEYQDTVDLDKLAEKEIEVVLNIQRKYEEDMKIYKDKSFRRFSKIKMSEITEEKQ